MQIITGKRIYFQQLTEADATEEYCKWLNDPEVNQFITTKKAGIDTLKAYIKRNNEDPSCSLLGIFFKENKKHIGNIRLLNIDYQKQKADIGIMIGDKNYWNKGLATEAHKLLVAYAFNKMRLKEIRASAISEHKASIRMIEKSGFKKQRFEKAVACYNGKTFNAWWFIIRKDEQ